MRISRIAVVVLALGAASSGLTFASNGASEQARRMFVSVTGSGGVPVAGLGPADFVVRVEGKDASIITAAPATEPLSIVVVTEGFQSSIISDARNALRAIVVEARAQHPESRVGLMLADGAAAPDMHVVSEDAPLLEREISRFFESSRNTPLLDAVLVAAARLSGETGTRRVILAVTVGASDSSVIAPVRVAQAVKDAGAALWAVEVGRGRELGSPEGTVLSEVTKSSGGRREASSLAALSAGLRNLVAVIGAQYLVTFESPVAGDVSTVGVRRAGLSVHAPAWAGLNLRNR